MFVVPGVHNKKKKAFFSHCAFLVVLNIGSYASQENYPNYQIPNQWPMMRLKEIVLSVNPMQGCPISPYCSMSLTNTTIIVVPMVS